MGGEWVAKKIGSTGRVVTGKTPSTSDFANFNGPYPFITIPDLDGRVMIDRTDRTLSQKGADLMKSCLLPPNAVMMSCIATVGRCGVTARPSFTNQQINSVIPNDDTDPRFLYYIFTQLGNELESAGGGGSVYTNVSKSRFSDIEVTLPEDISEQRAIAHIFGTLDDKIELNRRRNQTLEAMVRALFKDWFVDFGPIRAKMEGREPYLPADFWQLFPDCLDDDGKPEGWRRSTIGGEVTVCGGSTPSTKEPAFWEGGEHHWATPKDLSALTFPVLLDTDRKITDAGIAKISSGLLPVGTVLLSSRAPIGYLAIAEVPTAINQGFIAMKCDAALPNVFALFWCHENMDAILGNANGSTFQEISKSNFRPIPVIMPPKAILKAFIERTDPLYRHIVENERESRTLAQLRDTLLPKLISGELRIADAEKFAGATQ